MASEDAAPLSTEERRALSQLRHYYLQVSSQAQNRLTVSSFLAGLTFAAVATLLAVPNFPLSTDRLPSVDQLMLAVSSVLMSLSTLLFLLTAANTYAAMQLIADLSPSASRLLNDGTERNLEHHDVLRLRDAHDTYMRTSTWIPYGLLLMLGSLPAIVWHTSPYGFVLVAVALAFLCVLARPLRFLLHGRRRRQGG